MRTAFWLVALLLINIFCPAGLAVEEDAQSLNTPIKDKWALVVGISSFANPKLNLKYAAKDASDFKDFLIQNCKFAPSHVKLLTNQEATKDRILDLLGDSWLPRVTLPDDLVLIFISSHGSPSDMDVCGVNYVIAHDTNPDKLFTTGIPIQQLASTIKERVHSNRVLVILDACHSGGASDASKGVYRTANVDANAVAQGCGHMVMCSSAKNQSSWESKSYSNGVFTHSLMEALKAKGDATTLKEAFDLLKDKVQQQVVSERGVVQTPILEMSKWKGHDLVLATAPQSPRQAPIEVPETPTVKPVQSSAQPQAVETVIPDLSGSFLGTNGLHYNFWQKGRSCGWEMPLLGESCRARISEDGKSLHSSWTGPIVGSGTAKLECDQNGKVIRMLAEDGTVLNRISTVEER